MGDVRFRILAAIILSVAAFASMCSAIAAVLWWLIFTPRFNKVAYLPGIAGAAGMIGIISVLLQLTGGPGISYGVRMGAILLIAVWIWSEQQPGEYLAFGTWLLGRHAGFELGMTAELGMQAFRELLADFNRLKTAWAVKGVQIGISRIPSAGLIMVRGALVRAEDTAELLAVRGYRNGGSLCPAFGPGAPDILGCIAAASAASLAIIPVGEFFILLH